MEKFLDKTMEDVLRLPNGTSGVMCVDSNGLLLGSKGIVPSDYCGALNTLTRQATKLAGKSSSNPIICLESENASVLIKRTDDLTSAIFKENI